MAEINIDLTEIQEDYMLKYMVSVLEERAIPDLRDGCKPVQRYVVWDNYDSGYFPNKPFVKCGMVVGSIIGKYNPHGDAAAYDALVRTSQEWVNNIPLIDFHGNNANIQGDSAAHYRYTEERLSKYGLSMCDEILKNAVDFVPNYTNTLSEPSVLPAKVCNLLINGSLGIASGFVSSIPPHNPNDVCDMTIKLIKDPDTSLDYVAKNLRPDFPTGGIICNTSEITNAYKTCKGVIKIRGEVDVEQKKNGSSVIIIKSIPYLLTVGPRITSTSKNPDGGLVNSIVEKIKDGTIEGITDIQDHSKKELDIKIMVKKDYDPNIILQKLYKYTKLEGIYKVQLVCLNNKHYDFVNIKDILMQWIEFRRTTISRIIVFDINKLKRRIHVLDGLIMSMDSMDDIIKIIRNSADQEVSRQKIKKLIPKLTDVQVQAILDMKLHQLSKLEVNKLTDERKDKENQVKDLMINLKPENINARIIDEQEQFKKNYGIPRKTTLSDINTNITEEDIIEDEDCVLVLTKDGYGKRVSPDKFKTQNRNTQGNNVGDKTVREIFSTNTKDHLLCFTTAGRVLDIKVYKIPETNIKNKGMKLPLNLKDGERVIKYLCLSDEQINDPNSYLMFFTKNGLGKKTSLSEFNNINSGGLIAISLKPEDRIIFVGFIDGKEKMQDLILATRKGLVVRYDHNEFKPMGRTTQGMTAIKLSEKDFVKSACIISNENDKIFFVTKKGLGKTTLVTDMVEKKDCNSSKMVTINDGFPRLKRSSNIKGRIGITLKNDALVGIYTIHGDEVNDLIITTHTKVLTISTKEFLEPLKRSTQGKRLIQIKDENDYIVSVGLK